MSQSLSYDNGFQQGYHQARVNHEQEMRRIQIELAKLASLNLEQAEDLLIKQSVIDDLRDRLDNQADIIQAYQHDPEEGLGEIPDGGRAIRLFNDGSWREEP